VSEKSKQALPASFNLDRSEGDDGPSPLRVNHEVAATLPPCRLKLDGLVDGLNRSLSADKVRSIYYRAVKSYQTTAPKSFSIADEHGSAVSWLLGVE